MALYKIVRRWYTVQQIEADSEEEAVTEAKDAGLTGEDFYENDYEVGLVDEE
jgi:hypothetical protein